MGRTFGTATPAFIPGRELTLGQRAADVMRNGMGSWTFVFSFFGVLLAWTAANTLLLSRWISGNEFDPYPYILLNLFLSMLAAVQAAALLIAAKRADQIASELAVHDAKTDDEAKAIIEQVHRHTGEILERIERLENKS